MIQEGRIDLGINLYILWVEKYDLCVDYLRDLRDSNMPV